MFGWEGPEVVQWYCLFIRFCQEASSEYISVRLAHFAVCSSFHYSWTLIPLIEVIISFGWFFSLLFFLDTDLKIYCELFTNSFISTEFCLSYTFRLLLAVFISLCLLIVTYCFSEYVSYYSFLMAFMCDSYLLRFF